MKVTYTQNRFEIDGIEVINPELMGVYKCIVNGKIEGYRSKITSVLLKDGLEFNLPENIIAEKKYQRHTDGEWMSATKDQFERRINSVNAHEAREVYRLKLKESIERGAGDDYEVTEYAKQQIHEAFKGFTPEMSARLTKPVNFSRTIEMSMDYYARFKVAEYKEKLKKEIEKMMTPGLIANPKLRNVLDLIDSI